MEHAVAACGVVAHVCDMATTPALPDQPPKTPPKPEEKPPLAPEIGGAPGPEPTRYGDWQHKGRVTDF